jgi:anti-sigma B factor antagonist
MLQQPVISLPFEVEVEVYGATRTVTARGELDFAVAATLVAAMRRALDDAPQIVVLDLSGLTFVDAAGVRAVVSVHRQVRTRCAEVTIIPAPEAVHRVFVLAGVAPVLPFASVLAAPGGRRFARDPDANLGARARAA